MKGQKRNKLILGRTVLALVAVFALVLVFSFGARAADTWPECKKYGWEKNYEAWAKRTGIEEWADMARKMKTSEALKLGKAWAEYLGYDAVGITNESKIAPDIVPGLVITDENYQNYPGLKELLPEIYYKAFKKDSYLRVKEMRICPTQHLYLSKGRLEWTKKKEGTCKTNESGDLENYVAGVPFPRPKTGAEMIHNLDRMGINTDQCSYNPMSFTMYDRKRKLERIQKSNLFWRNYIGRCDMAPIPQEGEDIMERGSLVISYPHDVKGYCGIRTRFIDANREDSFRMYLPFLRRVRTLSGADTQDPIIGTDILWEDWKAWWQKLSTKIWPIEYKMIEEHREMLNPFYSPHRPKVVDDIVYNDWQRRPCWVAEVVTKTTSYIYSRRRAYIDKEYFNASYYENWDIRGNFFKTYMIHYYFDPEMGMGSWWLAEAIDYVNKHKTFPMMELYHNDPNLTDKNYTFKWLLKQAH